MNGTHLEVIMSNQQFFPAKFVLGKPTRSELASHIIGLRSISRELARRFVYRALWVGVIPPSPARMYWKYGVSS